jgi:hypothetical protein
MLRKDGRRAVGWGGAGGRRGGGDLLLYLISIVHFYVLLRKLFGGRNLRGDIFLYGFEI